MVQKAFSGNIHRNAYYCVPKNCCQFFAYFNYIPTFLQYGEHKIITIKKTTFGAGSIITGIFDDKCLKCWVMALFCLCALTHYCHTSGHNTRLLRLLETIGMFLDQKLAKVEARILLPVMVATFSFSMMYKSIIISHLIKPLPLRGPESLKELVSMEPHMRMLVPYFAQDFIPPESLFNKHRDHFILPLTHEYENG